MTPAPQPGRTVSHYRLVEKIGEGGMGVVWKAEDTILGRTVAVKVLAADAARNEKRRKMFLDEARLASSVSEAHIVQVHEFGSDGDLDFIVMEYVEGKPLSRLLNGRSLPPNRVAEIGQQVARALARAHRKGLLHRDLKPSNILVTPEGDAKVVDFGLATLFTRQETTASSGTALSDISTLTAQERREAGAIAGTVPYMSPEQLRGDDLDARSDVFSLGVVLYEMTTGQRPFNGPTLPDVAQRIQEGRPRPVHELAPEVPLDLERSIQKALSPRRSDRYQTMDDLAVDLTKLGRDLESGSSPSHASLARAGRRSTARWGVSVLAVIIVATLAGSLWMLRASHRVAADARTILILPLEVRGQTEGADFVGRAVAETIAVNLTRWKNLKVLPVPDAREAGDAGAFRRPEAARSMGAGILLTGALTRGNGKVEASVTLIDTTENRMLWGTQKSEMESALPSLGSSIAEELSTQLGLVSSKMYGTYAELHGGPKMSVSGELAETLNSQRAFHWYAYLEATRTLVAAFPEEPDAWVHRINALWVVDKQDEIPERRRQIDACLETLTHLDPDNPHVALSRAVLKAWWDSNYREAIAVYTKILTRSDLTPRLRAELLGLRGESESTVGETALAIADFREANTLEPSGDTNLVRLGDALLRIGDVDEAVVYGRQAVAIYPRNQNHDSLGIYLLYAGKYEESLDSLSKACHDENRPRYCAEYGWALSLSGHHNEALSVLSPLCDSDRNRCFGLAMALFRAGNKHDAESTLARTSALAEKDAVEGLASYHAAEGNRGEALRFLRRALLLDELDPMVAYNPNFASLHGDSEFQAIVAEVKKRSARPTR